MNIKNNEKKLLKIYIKSLNNADKDRLRILNKCINELKNQIDSILLGTTHETYITDIPKTNTEISIIPNVVVLRDNDGFYSDIASYTNVIENENFSVLFETLHSYLLEKEKIMNGNREIVNGQSRIDILKISDLLGYGGTREHTLNANSRKKPKIKTKK